MMVSLTFVFMVLAHIQVVCFDIFGFSSFLHLSAVLLVLLVTAVTPTTPTPTAPVTRSVFMRLL